MQNTDRKKIVITGEKMPSKNSFYCKKVADWDPNL